MKSIAMKWLVSLSLIAQTASFVPVAMADDGQAISVKTFRQIFAFYVNTTGVKPDQEIKTQFEAMIRRLPKDGLIDELKGSSLMASTNLAALFCGKMITAESLLKPEKRRVFGTVDFAATPTAALTDSVLDGIVGTFGLLFWQRDMTAEEKSILTAMLRQLADAGEQKPETTKAVLNVGCSVTASSLDALLL